MVFRECFARLGGCVDWQTDAEKLEGVGPPVPPRLRSQLAIRSSEPIRSTSQRRNPDGTQSRWSILSPQIDLGVTGATTSEVSPVSDRHSPILNASDRRLPVLNVGRSEPVELSSYTVDSKASYENKPNWKSVGLVVDVLKESSDVFTPLKSVAGGLSAILKHYDVRYAHFAIP
jgi:hypothetical protein